MSPRAAAWLDAHPHGARYRELIADEIAGRREPGYLAWAEAQAAGPTAAPVAAEDRIPVARRLDAQILGETCPNRRPEPG